MENRRRSPCERRRQGIMDEILSRYGEKNHWLSNKVMEFAKANGEEEACEVCGNKNYQKVHPEHLCGEKCRKLKDEKEKER